MRADAYRLSVIIPTYNRASTLDLCLAALEEQTAPHNSFEVLVSDDGSSDDTAAVAERRRAGGKLRLTYLRQSNAGANRARNRAIAFARSSVLLLINDDVIPTPTMVSEHLAGHESHPEEPVAILGRVTVAPGLPPSRLAALHLDRAFEGLGDRREFDWRAFYTCNVSMKKALLEKGGYFEERIRYHEDLELAQRLSHHGLRVIYRPAALGYHYHFLTEREFFAIARREAQALLVWSKLSPHLRPQLAELGFEPALPPLRRLRNALIGVLVNERTIPAWTACARRCPTVLEPVSLKIYSQVYQALRRQWLRSKEAA